MRDLRNIETSDMLAEIKTRFEEDAGWAYSWHANIAMSVYDTFRDRIFSTNRLHALSNEAASRFMKLAYGVETSNDMLDGLGNTDERPEASVES